MSITVCPAKPVGSGGDTGTGRDAADAPALERGRADRNRLKIIGLELAVILVALGFALHEAPGFASSIAGGFSRLRHPDAAALSVALLAEAVSIYALAQIPRWLLARAGVGLRRSEAVVLGMAANGMAVVLPAGTVSSSVWVAHQYNRRGARLPVATWVVLAAGFSSSVTLIGLLILGALFDGVASPVLILVVAGLFVAGVACFVALVHRAERLPERPVGTVVTPWSRLVALATRALTQTAGQRAGWSTGSAVLGASAVNWLADAACLASAFLLLRMAVPWRALLLAYAAGQLAGALVPLPGGLGAVEGGIIGVLIGAGVAAGAAVAVVAVYRLLGYWAPAVASIPAYGWARRPVEPNAGAPPDRTTVSI